MSSQLLKIDLDADWRTSELGADIALAISGFVQKGQQEGHQERQKGFVIYLEGALGAGKTGLARGLIRHLMGEPALEVPSPSFSIIQSYDVAATDPIGFDEIIHADLYRLGEAGEISELGLEICEAGKLYLIEWPQNGGAHLMPADLTIGLEDHEMGDSRIAMITGRSELVSVLKRGRKIRQFLEQNWVKGIVRQSLTGDASARAYETVFEPDRRSNNRILMNAPAQIDQPSETGKDKRSYSVRAHLAVDVSAFAGVQKLLEKAGLTVPEIFAADLDAGLLLLSDLGRTGIVDENKTPIAERYIAAAQMLGEFHQTGFERQIKLKNGTTHKLPDYDRGAMLAEIELLTQWYLPYAAQSKAGSISVQSVIGDFYAIWETLFDQLEQSQTHLVLRDFHSPNILWQAEQKGKNRIGVIDFQDAVVGPAAYDLASIGFDARVDVSPDLERQMFSAYCRARQWVDEGSKSDIALFEQSYAIMAAQRITKILGIFVRLDRRDGKPHYLAHLPRLRNYLANCFQYPVLHDYRYWFRNAVEVL